jgi:hypothetical protein
MNDYMTTIASTNAGAFTKSLHGSNVAGVYDVYTKDLYRYQLLYDSVISQMNTYIHYFSTGDYDSLTQTFTTRQYNSLILKANATTFNTTIIESLTGFEYDPEKFNLMRESAYNVIDGLEKTITVVKQNLDLQEDVIILKTNYKDVLEDPVKLRDYINTHKIDVIAFEATEIFNTTIELKPWYKVYFQKYGAPGNGVFQSELLAQIVIDLIKAGTITEDEFINS